jgi:holo-[acyl-carrier protein] synthase
MIAASSDDLDDRGWRHSCELKAVPVGTRLLHGRSGCMSRGTTVRVGSDVLSVEQVSESVARFGDRYLERVYTEHEISSTSDSPAVQAARLAARFAAKEATIKVLRPVGHQPDWRSMEVQRHPEGWCTMALTGHAATLAEEAGITDLAVSLTHDDDVAAAVVIALCERPRTETVERGGVPLDVVDKKGVV